MPDAAESRPNESRTPVPDPTLLTTQQLNREIAQARDAILIDLNGRVTAINAQFDAVQERIERFQARLDAVPSETQAQIGHLRELHETRFASVTLQFAERDVRTEQTSRDSKVAVDAALQAAKEAVGAQTLSSDRSITKSEAATTKQIDQLQLLIASVSKAQDDKNSDLKERLTRIEGVGTGTQMQHEDNRGNNADNRSTIAIVISALAIVAQAIYILVSKH